MKPTYIVTGGAGFVGSNLAAVLLAREPGSHIVVIDSLRSGSFENLVEACGRVAGAGFEGELLPVSTSELDFDELLDHYGPAAFFHLGAITDTTLADEAMMLRENVGGFGELLIACHGRDIPLVYASSAATYGAPAQAGERVPFPLEAAGRPANIYGFSKWLMECEHRRFEARVLDAIGERPRIVGLRYFNVFGPGESFKGAMASMVHRLARQMLAGERPRLFVDGSQARDQVYVEDVVECTLAAAGLGEGKKNGGSEGAPGGTAPIAQSGDRWHGGVRPGVYNLGSGVATSFNEVVDAVREGLGVSARELPTEYFEMPAAIRAFYQEYTCADMTETRRGIGWRPRWSPREAIAAFARSARQPGPAR